MNCTKQKFCTLSNSNHATRMGMIQHEYRNILINRRPMLNQAVRNHAFRALLVALALIGILLTRQYGESWDELKLYDYAADSLEAYVTWPQHGTIPITGDHFENYGPSFMMFATILKNAGKQILP